MTGDLRTDLVKAGITVSRATTPEEDDYIQKSNLLLKLHDIGGYAQYRHHGGFPEGFEFKKPFRLVYDRYFFYRSDRWGEQLSKEERFYKTARTLYQGTKRLVDYAQIIRINSA